MRKKLLCFFVVIFCLFSYKNALSQGRIVSGTVIDEDGQDPLPGVNVIVQGTVQGTVSDIDGKYSISVPDDNSVLVFSYVGYTTEEIVVGNRTVIDISLVPDISTLGEVVVIAYGEADEKEITGSIAKVKSDIFDKQPITTVEQTLVGQAAGVFVRQNTSAPGGAPEILIRGIGTLGAGNGPLYVIDGYIYGNNASQLNNPLSFISPNDIESITILKDAASAALYGSRASNGVVLITTKAGRKGKLNVSLDVYAGVQSLMDRSKIDVLNAQELAQFNREKFEDLFFDQNGRFPDESEIPDNVPNPADFDAGTDWYDEMTRSAPIQSYNINVQGGSEKTRMFLSAGYFNQGGTVIETGFKRYTLRSNITSEISSKFSVGGNINLVRTENLRNGGTDPSAGQFQISSTVLTSAWIAPDVPVRDANGDFVKTTQGSELVDAFQNNPVYEQTVKQQLGISNQTIATIFLDWKPIEGLSFRPSFNVGLIDNRSNAFTPELLGGGPFPILAPNSASLSNSENLRWLSENILTYDRTFGSDHNLNLVAGVTFEKTSINSSGYGATNLIDERFPFVNSGNVLRTQPNDPETPAFNIGGGESISEQSIASGVFRARYNYKEKYIFTGAFRRDGSSRFGSSVQFANFPSAMLGWRMSNESFMSGINKNTLSDLMLEIGYGEVGNNRIGDYLWRGAVVGSNYVFDGDQAVGRTVGTLTNDLLTWEETKEWNFGLNLGFFTNRLVVEADYYIRNTTNLINRIALPRVTGFGGVVGNIGELENRGLELTFNTLLVDNKDFKYNMNINLTFQRNKVIKLGEDDRPIFVESGGNGTPYTIIEVGKPVGLFYGLQFQGLYSQDDLDNPDVPTYAEGAPAVGSAKFLDADGDGFIERGLDDIVLIGDANPDFDFGWNHVLTYKNFELRMVFAGSVGQKIFDLSRELFHNFDGDTKSVFNVSSEVKNRWRPGDDLNSKTIPGTAGDDKAWRWPNSEFVKDASYIAAKNITLGYNFVTNSSLKNGYVYVTVNNAFVISQFDGNPEVGKANSGPLVRNVNYGSYPIARIFTGGFKFTF